ncbi:MAG: TetR/AcrR family transcriptional regulator [Fusobacteriaceae bacterium]|nr:TetR/AcrR family transcriptional regulator [Fusobacteriaceae bacterium]MBN2839264.1 TetR/AcrR family transcriptional regulator [Fusobacteriaceae bacterium]
MGRNKEFDEKETLEKAMLLFWEQGYEKTSINDLVEKMGIHRKSLYDTFGGKHELFLKVIENYNQVVKDKLIAEISKATTCKEAINTLFKLAIDSDFLGCLFVNSATELANRDKEIDEKVKESFSQSENFIEEIIKRGQKNGEFGSSHDSRLLAESIHSSLLGIRVLSRTSVEKDKLNRIAAMSMNLLYT